MSSPLWADDSATATTVDESPVGAIGEPDHAHEIHDPEQVPDFGAHPALRPRSAEDDAKRLQCTVSDPLKEAPTTRDAYISYLITTRSSFATFRKPEFTVRRRYNDFVFLHGLLATEYAACVIPPLPEKHASAYIKGGRFDADFTSRRCNSLDRFLRRCCAHQELKASRHLHTFLESPDWHAFTRSHQTHHSRRNTMDGDAGGVMEGIKDSLMSAFTKLGKPDKRFVDVRDRSDKLARDLGQIEKLVGKIVRREVDVEVDSAEMAKQFVKLAEYEPALADAFRDFATAVGSTADNVRVLREHTDASFLTYLRDAGAHNGALKALLRARDGKQQDFEALTEYQHRTVVEHETLASGSHVPNIIQQKVDNLRGLNHETVRRQKVEKLKLQADRLGHEAERAKDQSEAFDAQVAIEAAAFEQGRAEEMRDAMRALCKQNVAFYEAVIKDWEGVMAKALPA